MVKAILTNLFKKTYKNQNFHFLQFGKRSLSYTTTSTSSVTSISSNACFQILGLCKTVRSLKGIHALFIIEGLVGDLLCNTKLVSLYGSFGQVCSARKVFDRIPAPDFYSWKVMIRWYFLNDLYDDIVGFYNRMRVCVDGYDGFVFSIVLKACSELENFDGGRKVHCRIVKVGYFDEFLLTGLIDMYSKCGDIESSCGIFGENSDRSVVAWSSMIAGYVLNSCSEEGLVLFNGMRHELIGINQFTIGSLLTACTKIGALHQGKWVHGYAIKNGIEFNSYMITSLLDMYVKLGDIADAKAIFGAMSTVDVVSWTAMIVGYNKHGHHDEALKLFTDKKWVGVSPNNYTIAAVLSACSWSGNFSLGKSVHGLIVKLGLRNLIVTNALVELYGRCDLNGDAHYLFETALDRDVVTWNSMICAYLQNGSSYEALEVFHRMKMESIECDPVTLVTVFSIYASLGALRVGSSLHAYAIKGGFLSSNGVHVGTAILTFYNKCGDTESAHMVFDGMRDKNIVTWSAMIDGYGIQGDGSRSLALFNDMLKENVKPNEAIFTAMLSACSHTGMVSEGWKLFTSMCQEHKFVPSMKHYSCMVDMFARSGRLEEAMSFIEKMPVQPDVNVLGAFLHGCGLHSRLDLGEIIINRMLELHPDQACYYVLMCNMYASYGNWSRVKEVRERMKQRGLTKSPGCSLKEIDVDNDFSLPTIASHVGAYHKPQYEYACS